jgi:peptidoglycan-N-acetylglucosamine deacetylase
MNICKRPIHTFMIKIFLVVFIVIFISCIEKNDSLMENINQNGGVIFTFDDANISNWWSHIDYFKMNNIKCTYFLTMIHKYTTEEIIKLKELKNEGHELGYHGTHHINANEYLQNHSLREYYEYEILPDLSIMGSLLTHPISFAYPYGAKNDSLDKYLSNYFLIKRASISISNDYNIEDLDLIYVNPNENNRLVYGLSIESIHNITLSNIKKGLDKANINKEIIVFYMHNLGGDHIYNINFETFDKIINYIDKLGMSILTMSELSEISN